MKNIDSDMIISKYNECGAVSLTAKYFNTYPAKISKVLKDNGIITNKEERVKNILKLNGIQIINDYKNGISIKKISKKYNISDLLISRFLKDNNVEVRDCRNKMFCEKTEKEIVELYMNGASGYELAKKYSCNDTTIYKVLREHSVETRSNKENSRKYELQHNYFNEINTPDKAYWLGFIYADGYVTISSTGQKVFGISLSRKDRLHLVKLALSLKSNYPIHDYITDNAYAEGTEYSRLNITSDELVDNLIKHGVHEQKTDIIKPPSINEELVPHFLRGYFDGDGCVTRYQKSGYTNYAIKILGTKELLDWINDYVEYKLGFRIPNYFARKEGQLTLSYEISSCKRSKEFLDIIYKNANIYLDRKYNKYLELCEFMFSRAYQE